MTLLKVFQECRVACGVVPDEVRVEDRARGSLFLQPEQEFDGLEECHVAVKLNGQEQIRELGRQTQDPFYLLGVVEGHQAGFRQGVDRYNSCAVVLGLLEGGEHTGGVRAGILSHDDDHICDVEVVQPDRAFAQAQGFAKGRSARFVAHIRAVRQVIGAVFADEELVEEGCFVLLVRPEV